MAREELNIGALPGRKRKALSITTFHDGGGASVTPIAYFRSEEAYEHFVRLLGGRGLVLKPDAEEDS
jgi:hypothetical protein